ncbi:MAG: 2-amino-4-hydroxy-6-hydroxymethyldihydropteridine diphosphokinase [Rhodospirillaceae bacterium]|nr:2-amino-4-hydroxy-6-hydroxymethyldihydropteridine diphosphokinase [Rhodospirillaceae bacterium]
MPRILLGLGGNLGDRASTMRAAIAGLTRFLNVSAVSPVYETAPMYLKDQPAFLNLALTAETDMAPASLLAAVKYLEQRLGRVPGVRYGPRPIDIDILLFGLTIETADDLTIPHPRMAERGFVLVPAADVAGDWVHPVLGRTIGDMLASLASTADVVPYRDQALAMAATG